MAVVPLVSELAHCYLSSITLQPPTPFWWSHLKVAVVLMGPVGLPLSWPFSSSGMWFWRKSLDCLGKTGIYFPCVNLIEIQELQRRESQQRTVPTQVQWWTQCHLQDNIIGFETATYKVLQSKSILFKSKRIYLLWHRCFSSHWRSVIKLQWISSELRFPGM